MTIEGRSCTQCGEWKSADNFSWRGEGHKRLTSRCHACRRANLKESPESNRLRASAYYYKNRDSLLAGYRKARRTDIESALVLQAKGRAKRRGLEFDLLPSDISVPETCPVLGISLAVNDRKCGPNSPSLDRIDPLLGYVRGNVAVISHKANTIKSNATLAELEAVLKFCRAVTALETKP